MPQSRALALTWILCALIAYVALFLGLYALTGLGLPVCAVLPVAAVAFFQGLRSGAITAIAAIPLNLLMFGLIGSNWLDTLFTIQFISSSLGILLVGALLGRMCDLARDLRQQRDSLHRQVQERTASLRESHEHLKVRDQEVRAANMQLRAHEQQLVAVNEQLRAQEVELREINEDLENIFETKADGLIVTDHDSIIRVNQALQRMLGCSAEELLGRTIPDIAGMNADDLERARQMIAELYTQGSVKNRRFVWYKKDGSECPVEVNFTLLKNADGQPRGSVCEVRDISEHRRIDEERTRLIAAMEQTSESIMIFDRDGKIQYCNAALEHLTGYAREDLIGKSYTTTTNDTQSGQFYRELLDFVKTGAVWQGRFSTTVSDGTRREYETTISPVRSREGAIDSFVSIGRDVTRETLMEKQLAQAQKMEAIGTLAGGISHDFNNILTAIIGYTELSLREASGDSGLAARLNQVLKAGNRARDLVQQILTFSRCGDPEVRPIRFKSVLEEVLLLMRSTTPATIDIKTRVHTDAIVMADPTQLHQIVMNLCSNAGHAMSASGGTLTVTLQEKNVGLDRARAHSVSPGPYVCLEVKDTGTGISAENLDHIFEPFYTTKGKGEGTGMGLAMVHGIVSSCAGFVTVESAGPGHGTLFQVFLPAAVAQEPEKELFSEGLPGGDEHILFIDDEPDIVEVADEMLSALGYRVTATHKSRHALELFERTPGDFDLVITDRTMPKMTGLELAGHMRVLRPEIPIILCSGYRLDLNEESIRDGVISAALAKPLSFKNVAETVRAVLDEQAPIAPPSA
jgi:PAS domain S-box-containing protein